VLFFRKETILTLDETNPFAPPAAFGPFRVLHQIGIGVLGPVFRAYQPELDRLAAVKVFRLDITPEQAAALAQELEGIIALDLQHPAIVRALGAGVEGSLPYLAEEYVAAESLDVALRHYAPAAFDQALPFVSQLAGAIDAASDAGI
jgi:serine/threonine-protein kinase